MPVIVPDDYVVLRSQRHTVPGPHRVRLRHCRRDTTALGFTEIIYRIAPQKATYILPGRTMRGVKYCHGGRRPMSLLQYLTNLFRQPFHLERLLEKAVAAPVHYFLCLAVDTVAAGEQDFYAGSDPAETHKCLLSR